MLWINGLAYQRDISPSLLDDENITFTLLKFIPLVKYLWGGYWKRHNIDEFTIFKKIFIFVTCYLC